MPRKLGIAAGWIVLILVAGLLRIHGIGERPMHVDEGTGARILSNRLESGDYTFDPTHFHGPLQSQTTAPLAILMGETSWESLSETTLRVQPMLAGMLLVLVPLLWVRWLGAGGALLVASLLGTSPLLVYFNRMYIHESLLALLCMAALAFLLKWIRHPSVLWALATGILFGLMAATKETFIITLLSWSIAALLTVHWMRVPLADVRSTAMGRGMQIGIGIAFALVTAGLLYTDFLRHPQGISDALKTFFVYRTGEGHDKSFTYYFHLLMWPKWRAGILWWEGLPGLLALLGVVGFLRGEGGPLTRGQRLVLVFVAWSAVAHYLVYSLIAYKTPWLMLVPWAHVLFLAGFAWSTGWKRGTVSAMAGIAIILGVWQGVAATGRFANDARNPYAYAPTTKDVLKLGPWLHDLELVVQPESLEPLAVVGKDYWPLPWYLRGFDQIGYWDQPEALHASLPVVIVLPGQFTEAEALLAGSHTALPRGLRDNVPILLYLRNDIWNKWIEMP